MPVERRRERREPAALAVHFQPVSGVPADGRRAGFSLDASRGGLFVATRHPLPRRTVLRVEIFPLGSSAEPVVCGLGVVRWRRRWKNPRGMGVELLRVAEPDRRRLSRWLDSAYRPSSTT